MKYIDYRKEKLFELTEKLSKFLDIEIECKEKILSQIIKFKKNGKEFILEAATFFMDEA